MQNCFYLGPANEDCAQVGSAGYGSRSLDECRSYIAAIRCVCGPEPEGRACASSASRTTTVHTGRWCAERCDEKAPMTWAEAGMEAPEAAKGWGRGR
jgi:hypothetical protein